MKKILFLLFFIISGSVFSQKEKATMFFNDGLSIEGYGFIKNNKIKFRTSLDKKGEFWDYNDVQKIEYDTFFGTKSFEYIQFKKNKKPVLVEVVVRGVLSYFTKRSNFWNYAINNSDKYSRNTYADVKEIYIIKTENEFPSEISIGVFDSWKKIILKYVSDCPGLVKKIKLNELKKDDLKEIVEYYNDFCTEID